MKFDQTKIRTELDEITAELGGQAVVDGIIDAIAEKKQAAGQTALDAAKTFITLASGILVGLIGFVSYTIKPGDALNLPQLAIYALAALCLVAVMWNGMLALSKAWKDDAWTAETLRRNLNAQAGLGVVAIGLFVAAFAVGRLDQAAAASAPAVSIAISTATSTATAADRKITVSGRWSGDLLLTPRTGPAITIPAPADGQQGSFHLEWK